MADFDKVLALLNNSALHKSDNALYRALQQFLIESKSAQTTLTNSISSLDTKISATILVGSNADRLNYKPSSTINNLVFWVDQANGYVYVFNSVANQWVLITGADPSATFVTWTSEVATLFNSRILTAGSNITLDITTPGEIIVNSTASSGFTIGFIINDGSANTNAGPYLVSPRAGSISKVKAIVKQVGTVDLKVDFLKNGTSILSGGVATIPQGTVPGTIVNIGASATVLADDIFTLSIIQGTSSWQFTIQAEQ